MTNDFNLPKSALEPNRTFDAGRFERAKEFAEGRVGPAYDGTPFVADLQQCYLELLLRFGRQTSEKPPLPDGGEWNTASPGIEAVWRDKDGHVLRWFGIVEGRVTCHGDIPLEGVLAVFKRYGVFLERETTQEQGRRREEAFVKAQEAWQKHHPALTPHVAFQLGAESESDYLKGRP